MASRAPVTFGEMQRTLAERDRDVAALAAEVASLRMALGCIGIVNGVEHLRENDQRREIKAIVNLALGTG